MKYTGNTILVTGGTSAIGLSPSPACAWEVFCACEEADGTGRSHAVGVVDAGDRAGEEFELDTGVLEPAEEGHQLGGVADEALEFVNGEDDLLVGGGLLDVVRELQVRGPDGSVYRSLGRAGRFSP